MPDDTIDYVAEAEALGWVPKEKWTGDPEKWTDAESFVTKGEKILPLLVKNKRELAEKTRRLEAELEQMRKDSVSFREMVSKQAEREKAELEAQIQELKAAKAQAITDGEGSVAVEIDEKIDKLEEKQEKLDKKPDAGQVHPDYPAWKAANPWYGVDQDLTEMANAFAMQIAARNPNLQGKPLFDEIDKKMAKLAGAQGKEDADSTRVINKVETNDDTGPGSSGTRPRAGAKTYDNLPPEAKEQCNRYIKQGWFSDKQYKTDKDKREAYAKEYFANL